MNEKIKGFSKSAGNVGKKVAKFTGKVAVGAAILLGKEILEDAKKYQNNK